ncbi:zinc-dependent alcohol dehydrogenase [Spirosoma sp.]|uniref:zinc-dependent alcohol dehydrogenase n=1 Tax=Spirosoma sp. TaxID=1899569 RepID=UPI00262CC826|nr:zinc-dependent alcohol dehydrogenase [Spirosoma sp.]MCX6217354.1 glutathione-dependent formaldehyde dehydrogenase [Spirosoma sp.]
MLAMNFRGPRQIRLDRNKPEPEIKHPYDAIVRVTRSLICGSDLHLYHGRVPDTRVGMTFGHEFTGVVEAVGSGVQKLKVGDHVLVPFNVACGTCPHCKQELYGNCNESNPEATAVGGFFGYAHTGGGYDGGQAEYVRVPYADVSPTKIPEGMDLENAVLLTDVVPTGYQAAEQGGIQKGDTVVVFGAGPVGLMAARFAWFFGATRVIVIDHVDYRLEFARKFAFAEAYNFREMKDPVVFLKKATDYFGADVCIDAVGCDGTGNALQSITGKGLLLQAGDATALHWAINSVKKGGIVSIIGVYGPPWNLAPIGSLMNKGITVRANQASVKRLLPKLIDHIMSGRINPKEIITHRLPLEEVPDAYRMFSSKLDHIVKPLLIPPRAHAA